MDPETRDQSELGESEYVKAAFHWQYNWIAMVGAGLFAIVSGSALPAIMAAGVELMYLSAVPKIPRFRRLVRSWKTIEQKKILEWQMARLIQFLPPSLRKRYDALLGLCDTIRHNYYRLSSASQNLFVTQLEDHLRDLTRAYLGMLQSLAMHNSYLGTTNLDMIRKQADEVERNLERCPPKVKEINEHRLEILKKRIERFGSVRDNVAVLEAQCQAIEDVLALIRDQSVSLRDPQEISDQLSTLLQDVESTHETVREVEAIFEMAPAAGGLNYAAPGPTQSRVRT